MRAAVHLNLIVGKQSNPAKGNRQRHATTLAK
jgi:hypothetical protein